MVFATILLCACGGSGGASRVIAESPDEPNATETDPGPIDDLVERDAQVAADILADALSGNDPTLAAWAAVYARRLSLRHDEEKAQSAIARGTEDADPLLAALCWRWIAERVDDPLPPWRGNDDTAPEVAVFAWLACARRGTVPDGLRTAMHAGDATADAPLPDEWKALPALLAPFDNGPLAVAVAFSAARRRELAGTQNGTRYPLAADLRGELLSSFGVTAPAGGFPRKKDAWPNSVLLRLLDSPMRFHPPELLRRICVRGNGALQREAVRMLGAVGAAPGAVDLAAAAAAMASEDPFTRVEAARTYLLMVARATEKD